MHRLARIALVRLEEEAKPSVAEDDGHEARHIGGCRAPLCRGFGFDGGAAGRQTRELMQELLLGIREVRPRRPSPSRRPS
jgi:hypothetical protein